MKHIVVVGVLWASLAAAVSTAAQRPAPERPSEPFAVLVYTSASEPEDPESKYSMAKVIAEVAKRIKDRKKWFVLTEDPDRAEIRVEVVRHDVHEQMRTRMESRVDATGAGKHLVDVSWVQEEHHLEARVHLPGGGQSLLQGSDARENSGSLKRAASNLSENLELLCRERYWQLEPAR